MDSISRFDEIYLPPKESFYFKLSGNGINDEDYNHALKVWKVLE